jgi:mannose/fructose/N-acetylgalactosamine-specific phosphotransferase system component IIB
MSFFFHIDNRLIHGQVTVTWCGYYGVEKIVVVDNKAAKDPIQMMLLPQVARGIPTSVFDLEDGIQHLKDLSTDREKILVITSNPHEALALVEHGIRPESINIGNQAIIPGTPCITVLPWIVIKKTELEDYKKFAELNYKITPQRTPDDRAENFLDILKKKKTI